MHGTARERAERSVAVAAGLALLYAAVAGGANLAHASDDADRWPTTPVAGLAALEPSDQAPTGPSWSASANIDAAEVLLPSAPGGRCQPEPAQHRHRCSHKPWLWVGRHGAMVAGAPTAGLWIHPAPNAERTTIRWPDAPIGQRLQGRLGLERGSGNGGTVAVSAKIDDRVIGTWEVHEELAATAFDIEIPAGAARAPLEFIVFAHQDGRRLAVLEAVMVGERPNAPAEVTP